MEVDNRSVAKVALIDGLGWFLEKDMDCRLTDAEINHLRRLLGWGECEVGQSPDEMVSTVQKIAPAIHGVSEEGKARLVDAYQKASNVPKYVRSAIKALRKTLAPHDTNIVDAECVEERRIAPPNAGSNGPSA